MPSFENFLIEGATTIPFGSRNEVKLLISKCHTLLISEDIVYSPIQISGNRGYYFKKYHISRMQALLDDLGQANSMYRQIYDSSVNSVGSASIENEKYMDSLQARINLARVEIEKLALAIGDAFLTQGMVDSLKFFNSFLGSVTSFVDKFGVLPVMLGITSTALFLLSTRFKSLTVSTGQSTLALLGFNGATKMTAQWSKLGAASIKGLSVAIKGLAAASVVGLIFVGIGTALEYVIGKMGETRKRAEELESQQKLMTESFTNSKDEILQLTERYAELEEQLGSTPDPNTEAYAEYLEVQNRLAELMPELKQGEDNYGNSIVGSSSVVQAKIELLKQQLEYQKLVNEEQAKADRQEDLKIANETLDKYNSKYKNQIDTIKMLWGTVAGTLNASGIDLNFEGTIKDIDDARNALASVYEKLANPEGLSDNYVKQLESFRTELEKELLTLTEYENTVNGALSTIKLSSIDSISSATKNFGELNDETKALTENLLVSSIQFADSEQSVNDLNDAVGKMSFNTDVQQGFSDFFGTLDKMTRSSSENLESYKETLNSTKDTILNNSGLDSNSQAYKNLETTINNVINKQYEFEVSVRDLAKSQGISEEEARNQIRAIEDSEEAFGEANEELDKQIEKLKELSSAQEQIVGASESQISAVQDSIFVIETLGNVSERTASQEDSLSNSIKLLTALYPQLANLLNGTSKQREQAIKIIDAENKANQALIKAYELAANGKLTAEAKTTMTALEETNRRIRIINDEIRALDVLQQQYANIINNSNTHGMDELRAEKLSKQAYNRVQLRQAELATLSGKQSEYALSLQDTVNTIDEMSKSSSKSNSTTKDSIYYTDKYKKALEALNLEIEKQQALREGEVDYSEKYRKSLEAQIKLEKQKLELQRQQSKSLEQQIKSGKIQQTGNVSTSSSSTSTTATAQLNGWSGRQTSGYGNRIHPVTGKLSMHGGVDLAGYTGQRLDANVNGKVVASGSAKSQGYSDTYGNIVVIQDGNGLKHLYAHLSEAIVKVGQQVSAGTQIGKIGATGRVTGSHLHYQINNKNGKTIDPSDYIADARNGVVSIINTTNAAIDNSQQAIDSAQSDLMSLKGDVLAQENLIRELEQQIIESNLSSFNAKRDTFNRELDYESAKIQEVDTNSSRYVKTLELMKTYMTQKQKANKDELKYLQQQIGSGKLSNEMLEQMKIRYKEVTTEIKALQVELRQMDYDIIINIKVRSDEKIDDIEYQMSRLQEIRGMYEEGSGDYNASIQEEIKFQQQLTKAYESQRNALQNELKTRVLNAEQLKELNELLEDLSISYWSSLSAEKALAKQLEESNKALAESIADGLWSAYQGYVKERQDEHMKAMDEESKREEDAHKKRIKMLEDEMNLYRKNVQEKLNLIDKQEAERDYNMDMEDLQKQRNDLERLINFQSFDTSNEGKAKLKELQKQLDDINKDIAERQHDRNITLQKETLNEMLEMKEEENQGLQDLEDERYDGIVNRIDSEKEYWEKHYTDLANDERKHAQLREDVMKGNFTKIEAEFGKHISNMEATMPSLEDTLDGTMVAVGTSIRQNVIESLKEAISLMNEFKGSKDVTGGYNGGSTGSAKSSLSNADLKVIMGKYMTSKLMYQETNDGRRKIIEESAWNLANQGRSEGSSISKTATFDSILNGLSGADLQNLANYMSSQKSMFKSDYLQDYVQDYINQLMSSAARLNTGGMIPNASGGVDGIGGKFAIVHPNEVIHNPIDTERLLQTSSIMERVANLIKPISSNILKGINNVTNTPIIVQFGDVVGATPQQADNFANRFISEVKRKGGTI